MRQLSLVVTCTDRKITTPDPDLRVQTLPEGDVDHRVSVWTARIDRADDHLPLNRLYKGEHWVQVGALIERARQAGFTPELWVVSAGLGLQPALATAPSYAAALSPRHADSVASTSEERIRWWARLQAARGAARLQDLAKRGPVLLVLSEVYATALNAELCALGEAGDDVLLVGGDRDVTGIQRVPANRALRRALGGTLTSLNVRMAISWLEHCSPAGRLTSSDTTAAWTRWAESVRSPERYDRTPMSDEAVRAFIRVQTEQHPEYSRTRLHRLLRESGRACEQKRFAMLYAQTMGA
ncbi:hypothetical protein HNR12_003404 [Streptomonospora nanhaiensis]|uniref:Uncharacterized protein n=1 Tax=Streptomonospora nanhaiensis TaxID=1323731 RepID=A0A853BRE2_9ACTN|nr:hypothetical protein [Streptomonospora nanhaiensis]NYI97127.1 hypothetical protein [Streptomonospora nanhaiensis]